MCSNLYLIGMNLNITVGYEFFSRFFTTMLIATDINANVCTDGKSIDESRMHGRVPKVDGWVGRGFPISLVR
jgi:hypothetical protein